MSDEKSLRKLSKDAVKLGIEYPDIDPYVILSLSTLTCVLYSRDNSALKLSNDPVTLITSSKFT